MKRPIALFLLLVLIGMVVPVEAASNNVPCSNVTISSLTINHPSGVAPLKVGFVGIAKGSVKQAIYTVTDQKTGKVIASSSSFCGMCTRLGICSCSTIVPKAGTFDVTMKVYGKSGCIVTLVKKAAIVVTAAKPIKLYPGFSSSVSKRTIYLRDQTSGGATSWKWSFGDGYYSTAKNPSHIYKKAGNYKVTLSVDAKNCIKCVKSISKTVSIKR